MTGLVRKIHPNFIVRYCIVPITLKISDCNQSSVFVFCFFLGKQKRKSEKSAVGSEGWEEGESEEEHEEELEEADEDGEDKEKNDEKEIKEEEREEQITSKKDEGIKEEDETGKEEACPSSTRTTDESKSHDVFNTIFSHFSLSLTQCTVGN